MIRCIAERNQGQSKGASIRRLCQVLWVNRAWYDARQTIASHRIEAETELRAAVEPFIQSFSRSGDRRVTKRSSSVAIR